MSIIMSFHSKINKNEIPPYTHENDRAKKFEASRVVECGIKENHPLLVGVSSSLPSIENVKEFLKRGKK